MTAGFEVGPEQLTSAAGHVRRVADEVAAATSWSDLKAVAQAMPGSQSIAAAEAVTEAWRTHLRALSSALGGHAQALAESAQAYVAEDRQADGGLSRAGSSLGGGPLRASAGR